MCTTCTLTANSTNPSYPSCLWRCNNIFIEHLVGSLNYRIYLIQLERVFYIPGPGRREHGFYFLVLHLIKHGQLIVVFCSRTNARNIVNSNRRPCGRNFDSQVITFSQTRGRVHSHEYKASMCTMYIDVISTCIVHSTHYTTTHALHTVRVHGRWILVLQISQILQSWFASALTIPGENKKGGFAKREVSKPPGLRARTGDAEMVQFTVLLQNNQHKITCPVQCTVHGPGLSDWHVCRQGTTISDRNTISSEIAYDLISD